MLTAFGRALRRALLLLLLSSLTAAVTATAPAGAQENGGGEATASGDQLRGLVETLEDPAKREELLEALRALLEAQEAGAEPSVAEGAVEWLDEAVSRRTDIVQQVVLSIVDSLDQVPSLFDWLVEQAVDPGRRALWLQVGFQVALILGLGIGAYLLAAFVPHRARSELRGSRPERLGARLAGLLGWFAVELLPILAFAAVSHAVLAALDPIRPIRLALVPLINAGVIGRTAIAVARVVLAPKVPGLRALPLGDEGAAYAFRWTRRIVAAAVYGTFILEAGLRLGLPWTIHASLLTLLYLAVAAMVATTVVQRRERVAAAIARLGEGEERTGLRRLPWQGIAQVWHLLALLYVASAYLVWAVKVPGGFRFLIGATIGSAAVLLGTWAAFDAIERRTEREVRTEEEEEEPAAVPPGAAAAAAPAGGYLAVIAAVGRGLVGVVAALALLQIWGADVHGWLDTEAGRAFGRSLITVVTIAAVTLGLWVAVGRFLQRAMAAKDAAGNLIHTGRTRTLLNIARSILLVFLGLIAGLLVLSELGVNIAPLLAGAGVIGLAIGFGSQKLVQDIITGMFVLLGDTIRVGDVVQLGDKGGVVEAVTMRTVRLRGYEGYVHTIPYSAIDTVTNMTKDFSFYVFDVGVAYKEDVDQVMDVMRAIGAEMQRDRNFRRLILEPLEVAGVDRFAASAVIIKARIKTLPLKQWEVGREFNRRMKMRFDELGIEIPFPHQTLYFGVDKRGEAPPARVRVEDRTPPPIPETEPGTPPPPPPPHHQEAAD